MARGTALGVGHGLALLLVANVAALVAGALLVRLVRRETGDVDTARRASWYLALAPASFVFAWGYTEPLAVALACACLLFVRRGAWWAAAGVGAAAGLTRPSGALLAVPVLIEVARARRGRGNGVGVGAWSGRVAAVAAPVAGVGAYLAWVGWRFGGPLLPLRIQQGDAYRGAAANPAVVTWEAMVGLAGGRATGNAFHVAWIVVAVALAVVAVRRLPAAFSAYAVATVAFELATAHLGSFERYVFTAFPVVWAAAAWATSAERDRLVTAGAVASMAALGTLALVGGYVP